jgi:alpha-L-arabinofuranosidase
MVPRISHPWLVLLVVGVVCQSAFAQNVTAGPPDVTIRIDASKIADYKIPRSIFGSFLESIGNSVYNGLWAEILQNPSFEDSLWDAKKIAMMLAEEPRLGRASELSLPLPWEPLDYTQGARYAPQWGDAANSYRSLLLMALPGKHTGVRQKVYLPTHRTLHYTGSVYLKYLSGPQEVEVSLRERNQAERILAAEKLTLKGSEWQKYDFTLDLEPHRLRPLEPADFVIAASNETRVLVDQASLVPGDAVEGMDPDMIAMARALKSPVIRFGGNFTSAYHWRDGIGPRDRRVSMLNIAWGIPEYNQFGTDEFLRFCELIGAQPQIALNLGTGTPSEAAEWVQYVDEHWNHASASKSGGLLWELGNELWGNFQVGYPTLPRVADRTRAFSEAVKKTDPNARLIATGADPDNFEKWNAAQLANAPQAFDYLSTHFVVTTNSVVAHDPSPDFIAQSTFALPIELERRLRNMHKQFQESHGGEHIRTAFTEWLFWAENDTAPRYDNMGGAVATGGFLNMLLRNADIVPIADMTGIIEFGGIWKKRGRVFGVPAYWAFRMYSNAGATRPVQTITTSETYDVENGSTRLPNIGKVPYLDVVAALNDAGDRLTLFCVNRDLSRDMPAHIHIDGFMADAGTAQSLYAGSIYEKNDEVDPDHVHPHVSTLDVTSSEVSYDFRHASVTVLDLTRK